MTQLVCVVCGDVFVSRGSRRVAPVCSESCRGTLTYWRSRGLVRLRVRIRMRHLQDLALGRIERLLAAEAQSG